MLVEQSAYEIALDIFETFVREGIENKRPFYQDEEVFGSTPEWWASVMAGKAAEIAADLSKKGATAETLRHKKSDRDEQLLEYVKDKWARGGADQLSSD
ncbi:hypothetical protein [Phaeobacter sp. B1627]|uniref:hypothetical protein n=1 Tax=Phaeobacter sp. B1627 TaxID=2583809 RepID=UPI001117D15E|nr:hypothetical protein [Phaeobacter sp. B1627]TNJ46255.1 hypothetical protein FGE21_05530 [Phaeobacter sp. B1627]